MGLLKRKITTFALLLMSMIGLALLLYPSVANAWNERHSTRIISSYVNELDNVGSQEYAEMWAAALAFNEKVSSLPGYVLPESMYEEYESVLNLAGLGIMGYVEIPKLRTNLPIYHGTSDSVLQSGCGHIEWTNLPIGGESTHCAISGHRGLSSARILTDLPTMQRGDEFCVRVLDELMTYEVDQIVTVLPWELSDLRAEMGEDYFTLITCTPYAVNTHRLLVRGHRVANGENARRVLVPADAVRIEPLLVAPILAIPVLMALITLVFVAPVRTDTLPRKEEEDG